MNVEEAVKTLIEKVGSGSLDKYAAELSGTDLGLYIPTYVDGDTVSIMPEGFSQLETDKKITITKGFSGAVPKDMKTVAWMGDIAGKDTKCSHGGTHACKHCTSHGNACRHCSGHKGNFGPDIGLILPSPGFDAPELDHDKATQTIESKQETLKSLATEGFGLALLHGHSDIHQFTQLPEGYLSVISNGQTHFRTVEEVAKDNSFVPNMWRSVGGVLKPAGGYSQL